MRDEQANRTYRVSSGRARGHRRGRPIRRRVLTHLCVPSEVDALRPHPYGGRGGNGAMLILEGAADPPIAFSASLPGCIQLSRLPDPRSVSEAMVSPKRTR